MGDVAVLGQNRNLSEVVVVHVLDIGQRKWKNILEGTSNAVGSASNGTVQGNGGRGSASELDWRAPASSDTADRAAPASGVWTTKTQRRRTCN